MAFRNKTVILDEFNPDIAIIQETESKEVLETKKSKIEFNDYIWLGKNKNKGLGVMTFNGFHAEPLDLNEDFQYILPVRIYKDQIEFFLLAIWTQFVNKSIYESYVVQAARSFKYYNQLLKKENVLIIGDFNSNAIWDNDAPKEYNHSQMVNILKEEKFVSVYHENKWELHGKEKIPTLYFTRNKDKRYHVDYFFIKEKMLKNIKNYYIGEYENYINQSDHMPLFVELQTAY